MLKSKITSYGLQTDFNAFLSFSHTVVDSLIQQQTTRKTKSPVKMTTIEMTLSPKTRMLLTVQNGL